MFGNARRKTHSQLAKRELSESLDHFVQAATHAARGTGATVGPKMNAARDRVTPAAGKVKDAASTGWGSTVATLAPLAAAATEGARRAGNETRKTRDKNAKATDKKAKAFNKKVAKATAKKKSGRGSKLASLLVAGAALGALGAVVMRRRQQQQWNEYDPGRPVGGAHTEERVDVESTLPASLPPNAAGTLEDPTPPDTAVTIPEPGVDQTSSPMHNPTVARMAEGTAPADDLHNAGSTTRRTGS